MSRKRGHDVDAYTRGTRPRLATSEEDRRQSDHSREPQYNQAGSFESAIISERTLEQETEQSVPSLLREPQMLATENLTHKDLVHVVVRDEYVDYMGMDAGSNIVPLSHLQQWYQFVSAGVAGTPREDNKAYVQSSSVELLLAGMPFATKAQMLAIAQAHKVSLPNGFVKEEMKTILCRDHACDNSCRNMLYLFQPRLHESSGTYRIFPRRSRTKKHAPSTDELNAAIGEHRGGPSVHSTQQQEDVFPVFCDRDMKHKIIREWQEYFDDKKWEIHPCAVCAQGKRAQDVTIKAAADVPLALLRNDHIPCDLWPKNYDFNLYDRAFLYAPGLKALSAIGDMEICRSCLGFLERDEQPPDAIANFQYYAHDALSEDVKNAFRTATAHEIQLVSACRATRLSYVYKKDSGFSPTSQRYCRGNVAIIPQDVAAVHRVLPPSPEDLAKCVCVLFVGGTKQPTRDELKKLGPVLVSKSRVRTMLDFLIKNNPFYKTEDIQFSATNLENLIDVESENDDVGLSRAIEICHAERDDSMVDATSSRYDARSSADLDIPMDETLMEVVGYANGSQGGISHDSNKMRALQLSFNNPYLLVRGGDRLFPDRDPRLLSFVFPHLDPCGLGAFRHPLRDGKQRITFEHQLRNLTLRHEQIFERDANLAFVGWNIIQKHEVSSQMTFRVKDTQYRDICAQLLQSTDLLEKMNDKYQKNPSSEPSNREEKKMLAVLNKLKVISKDLRGSNGHRLHLRNEIRSMLKTHGCPALFVTLNPSDIHHKLLHILSGGNAASFAGMDAFARAKEVAQNPRAAAQFFDHMIQAFVKIILRHGDVRGGLFGHSKAYYGTVEAQGRGTLHCHMLIWIRGNLSPQKLRDRMATDSLFKETMFSWIESVIKCELPDMKDAIPSDHRGRTKKPLRTDRVDVRTTDAPYFPVDGTDSDIELFEHNFKEFVEAMAIECNWHEHRDTCWKHLKQGEPRDDKHCRMRVDGKTRAMTELDPATFSILIRRLHPWINNFNDLIMFLMKCNMDVKFIGSGEAAKALVYYVTDYITKASLPAHLGLSALCYAMNANKKKFSAEHDVAQSTVYRSLITKIVNAMMAQLELSQQQVMSYLLGGGDRYTSDVFRTLYYGELDRFLQSCESGDHHDVDSEDDYALTEDRAHEPSADVEVEDIVASVDAGDEVNDGLQEEGRESGETHNEMCSNLTLRVSPSGVSASSLLMDYRFRNTCPAFESLSVWEHASVVEKVTIGSQKKGQLLHEGRRRGSARGTRVNFSGDGHPQFKTHVSYLRRTPNTPLYLGPSLPRGDRGQEERERWCRAMLILFKPWRTLRDLKEDQEAWIAAYNRTEFSPGMNIIIDNIGAENECRDAREEHETARREGIVDGLLDNTTTAAAQGFYKELEESAIADDDLDYFPILPDLQNDVHVPPLEDPSVVAQNVINARVTHSLQVLDRAGIFNKLRTTGDKGDDPEYPRYSISQRQMEKQQRTMKAYKSNRRPRVREQPPPSNDPELRKLTSFKTPGNQNVTGWGRLG